MRGEPLRLCAKDHGPIWYTGSACPICELRIEIAKLQQALRAASRPPAER